MPKRRRSESKEDRWRRKMKRYEEKIRTKGRVLHLSDDDLPRDDPEYPVWDAPHPNLQSQTPKDDEMMPEPESAQPPTAEVPTEAPDEVDQVQDEVDPELLKALGVFDAEAAEWGEDINSDVARRWEPILKDGMRKEQREELTKKYLFAQNCPLLKPPTLNPEIGVMLNESSKNRDARIAKKQAQLGCALTILGKAMSGTLTRKLETTELLHLLSETGKLIADSHYTETDTRRALITPMIDKSLMDPFKNRKRDSYLFGEKLGDFIKSSRGIKKTGQLIQPTSTTTHLNWKGPRQQQQRAPRIQPSRVGGPRAPLPPPPPPPAYRRRAPPPAPPARRAPMMSQPPAASAPPPYRQQQAPAPNYRH